MVGDQAGMANHIEQCVSDWSSLLQKLVLIAETQPQLAYSALTRSVQCKWTYFQKVTPDCCPFFESLERTVTEKLLPSIFGCEISPSECMLFSLRVV